MEIKESRSNRYYYRPGGSLHRSQFSITYKLLILKGRILWGFPVNITNKIPTLNT